MVLSPLENQLKEATEWSLKSYLVSNAVFLSERLSSEPSSTTEDEELKLHLLAKCYLAESSPHKVVLTLKNCSSVENLYLYALACFQTSKLDEAERALLKCSLHTSPEVNYLLGQICERQSRIQDAISYYSKALNLNSNLWTAFEKLCELGYFIDTSLSFKTDEKSEHLFLGESPSNFHPLTASNFGNWSPPPKLNSPAHKTPAKTSKDLKQLLAELGKAYQALSQYNTNEAMNLLKALPDSQKNSGWALCQMGRCCFEKYDFAGAVEYFQRAFQKEPQRTEDTDYYSSALWYEKKNSELCYTLHNALKNAYYAPQTWVIAGNFYSLQKERETAIKCFTRAIQLNPFYSYAYALCGHEHLANEDFDQARYHYESANNIDSRQYTALWGLGSLYFKQEKYTQSLQCYKAARSINPNSSIILTYLGVNYKATGHYEEAINCFESAIRIDKKNPLPKFQLGILLSQLDRDQEALSHLETLCQENSRESHLYIQIGKIYAKLGQPEKALRHYNDAQELNPKNHSEIKNLIEQLHGSSNLHMMP